MKKCAICQKELNYSYCEVGHYAIYFNPSKTTTTEYFRDVVNNKLLSIRFIQPQNLMQINFEGKTFFETNNPWKKPNSIESLNKMINKAKKLLILK